MYVCVCLAVPETEVDAAIANGAHTREAVTRACRAGGDCGACHGMIDTKIEDHLEGCESAVCPKVAPAVEVAAAHESGPSLVTAEALVRRVRAA